MDEYYGVGFMGLALCDGFVTVIVVIMEGLEGLHGGMLGRERLVDSTVVIRRAIRIGSRQR
jgi:hypothetical protein